MNKYNFLGYIRCYNKCFFYLKQISTLTIDKLLETEKKSLGFYNFYLLSFLILFQNYS